MYGRIIMSLIKLSAFLISYALFVAGIHRIGKDVEWGAALLYLSILLLMFALR
jgi:hypothetical protein